MQDEEKTEDQLIEKPTEIRKSVAEFGVSQIRTEDIIEPMDVAEALRESERMLASLLNNLPGFVYRCANDRDWTMEYISQGCLEVTGYAPDDFIRNKNLAYNDIVYPDYREPLWEKWQDLLIRKAVFEEEYPIIAKGGEVRWVWERGRGIFSEDGRLLFLEGFITDITERKRAEESLRNSVSLLHSTLDTLNIEKQRFQKLAESAPFSMVIIQPDGSFSYANPKFTEMFGYELSDVPNGKEWFKKAFPDPRLKHEAIAAWIEDFNGCAQGETRPRVFPVIAKDGTEKTIHFRPVKLVSGEDLMTCEDITDRKRAEQEKEELQTQYLQAQKMEAVGNLAGGIAHDFNNLLQIVLGYSEVLLKSKKQGDTDYNNIQKINQAGKRGADLVKSLLMFSRKVEPAYQSVSLNQEILQVQSLLSRTIPKTIKIDLHLSGDLESVKADPSQLGQILINLGVNARDAMPDGGTLTFKTSNAILDEDYCSNHLEVKPGRYVLLTVSDTGHGMDKECLGHIFEPFFTTKSVGKGTGLGLATVYGIIKQHNGHIMCSSEPEQGTTFKIYIPAIQTKQESDHPMDEVLIPGGSETILLVEDDEVVRELCESLLNSFGYKVVIAGNGKEALEIYQKEGNSISLVILDLIMPEMDGRQCLTEILRIDPKARVLIASGYSASGAANWAVKAGAKGFVEKPYDMTKLLTKVREVLDNS